MPVLGLDQLLHRDLECLSGGHSPSIAAKVPVLTSQPLGPRGTSLRFLQRVESPYSCQKYYGNAVAMVGRDPQAEPLAEMVQGPTRILLHLDQRCLLRPHWGLCLRWKTVPREGLSRVQQLPE